MNSPFARMLRDKTPPADSTGSCDEVRLVLAEREEKLLQWAVDALVCAGDRESARALLKAMYGVSDASELRARRKDAGLSQAQLAYACGFSQSNLSKLELGKRAISGYTAAVLERAFIRLERPR